MRSTLYLFIYVFVGSIVFCTSCQNDEMFPGENEPDKNTVENPYVLTQEASVDEAAAFMSRVIVKEGNEISLRSEQPENLSYTVKTNTFSVSLDNEASVKQKKVQNVPVHAINYKNSQGEEAGYALTIADERFLQKVIAFSETGNIDLANREDADFWQDRINGYLYQIVNNPELQADVKLEAEKAVSLRSEPEKIFYQHSMDFRYNWHQSGVPFTDYTPFRNGQRASAGCVAVGMGMIMAWHQWPLQGAYPRYEKDASGRVTLRNITTNYSRNSFWTYFHPLSWRNELSAIDPKIRENTANLLAEIAYKLNSNFMTVASTEAFTNNIYAVFTQMGYNFPYSSKYFDSSLVLKDVDNEQPVLMSGKRERTEAEIKAGLYPGHTYVVNGVITQGATNSSGVHVDLKKPVYIYIMNGNAGSGDGWFLEEMFSENSDNSGIKPDGREGASYSVYKYRYHILLWTGIKPNSNNPGSNVIWRVSDDKNYRFTKFDY